MAQTRLRAETALKLLLELDQGRPRIGRLDRTELLTVATQEPGMVRLGSEPA
jgi:hypothetical protein